MRGLLRRFVGSADPAILLVLARPRAQYASPSTAAPTSKFLKGAADVVKVLVAGSKDPEQKADLLRLEADLSEARERIFEMQNELYRLQDENRKLAERLPYVH